MIPSAAQMQEWAASPEGKHFRRLLRKQVEEGKDHFAAGLYNRDTIEQTAFAHRELQSAIQTTERVIATLEDMSGENELEGDSNA